MVMQHGSIGTTHYLALGLQDNDSIFLATGKFHYTSLFTFLFSKRFHLTFILAARKTPGLLERHHRGCTASPSDYSAGKRARFAIVLPYL
jgi:hypothetical protein